MHFLIFLRTAIAIALDMQDFAGHGIQGEARFGVALHQQFPSKERSKNPDTSRGRRHYQFFGGEGKSRSYSFTQ
jgi:hypothetical protein